MTTVKRLLALRAQRSSKRLTVVTSGRLGGPRPPDEAAGGSGRPLASAPPVGGHGRWSCQHAGPPGSAVRNTGGERSPEDGDEGRNAEEGAEGTSTAVGAEKNRPELSAEKRSPEDSAEEGARGWRREAAPAGPHRPHGQSDVPCRVAALCDVPCRVAALCDVPCRVRWGAI